jgi:hypothetical protein
MRGDLPFILIIEAILFIGLGGYGYFKSNRRSLAGPGEQSSAQPGAIPL